MAAEHRYFNAVEPGYDPDFRVAVQSPLQGRVGLEVTVVQIGVHGLPACSSADFQLQHVFQTLHHLYQGFVDPGLLEQEDVIRAVVELFHAVPGRLKHSWVIGLYWFGKSWSHTGVYIFGAKIWGVCPMGVGSQAAEGKQNGRPHGCLG